MKKLITTSAIFGAGFALGRAIYRGETRESNKRRLMNAMHKLLFGLDAETYWTSEKYKRPYMDYNAFGSYDDPSKRHRANLKNHIYKDRQNAQKVMDKMNDFIHCYGFTTLQDLSNCIKDVENCATIINYRDCEYGWYNLSEAKIYKLQSGYIIKWPYEKYISDVDDYVDPDIDEED